MKLAKLVYNGTLVGYRYRVDNNIFDNYLLGYANNIGVSGVRKTETVCTAENYCYFTSDEYSMQYNKFYINDMNDKDQLILADNLNNMYKRNPNFKLNSSVVVRDVIGTPHLGIITDYNFLQNLAVVFLKKPEAHTEIIDMGIIGGR